MQGLAVVRFTTEVSHWEPETFVRTVLVEWLHVAEVWVGANFLFGHNREGNFSVLRSLGARYGFRAEKIDPVRYKDFVVSSTRVRRLVSEGRVDEAGALLGHHYFIDGVVVRGAGRGRELGFPTANVQTENELPPPSGVYATTVTIDDIVHASVTNIGMRPTFGDVDRPVIEAHIFDYYARSLRSPGPAVVPAAAARRARVSGCRCAARADRRRLPQRAPAVRPHFAVEFVHMPEPTGKHADRRALDLRLSVPAEGDLREIAGELAAKIAEQLGRRLRPTRSQLGAKVAGLALAAERTAAAAGPGDHLRIPPGRGRAGRRGPLRRRGLGSAPGDTRLAR